MRPVREAAVALVGGDQAPAAAAHAHAGVWRTPTPYLFLGFAIMTGLIAVALLMLLCTRRKPSTGASRRGSGGTAESVSASASARGIVMTLLDREPKVVVIMAGDDMPSFIASARPFAHAAAVDAGEQHNVDAV